MKTIVNIFILLVSLSLTACSKFLDKKSDSKLAIPEKAEDFQALLDNTNFFNVFTTGMSESSADDYYLTEAAWTALTTEGDRNLYIWEKEVVFNLPQNTWRNLYACVNYANIVLKGAEKFYNNTDENWRNVMGSACFYRANALNMVAETWAKAYNVSDAKFTLGIPLRLDPDFNRTSTRSNLQETFDQIIADLKTAIPLLPQQAKQLTRPSKAAAYALLSRVYLYMRDYPKAGLYADSSLQINNQLLNYNTLSTTAAYPFPRFNKEVMFHMSGGTLLTSNVRALIDSNLYRSYATNDLRKTLFFRTNADGSQAFRGSYDGSSGNFVGIATDETYLTAAECKARSGDYKGAMTLLNTLLVTRWKPGTYIPFTVSGNAEALSKILIERRKELLLRDLRWMDIKRLNLEGAAITLKRQLGAKTYTLPPNDNRFALPIPQYVIDFSGMEQNPR
ncbi:MAG: RagB/SusD family nutrient uptake outer membrane protein [Sphingobacteriia bacterium]|nr:RagB/SusD family nutrient uptake outer membrane protein [Sphingobacteriia bacterium]